MERDSATSRSLQVIHTVNAGQTLTSMRHRLCTIATLAFITGCNPNSEWGEHEIRSVSPIVVTFQKPETLVSVNEEFTQLIKNLVRMESCVINARTEKGRIWCHRETDNSYSITFQETEAAPDDIRALRTLTEMETLLGDPGVGAGAGPLDTSGATACVWSICNMSTFGVLRVYVGVRAGSDDILCLILQRATIQ